MSLVHDSSLILYLLFWTFIFQASSTLFNVYFYKKTSKYSMILLPWLNHYQLKFFKITSCLVFHFIFFCFFCMCVCIHLIFWDRVLLMLLRPALNSWTSCLSLLSAGIIVVYHRSLLLLFKIYVIWYFIKWFTNHFNYKLI
jgi:hypothetical protein